MKLQVFVQKPTVLLLTWREGVEVTSGGSHVDSTMCSVGNTITKDPSSHGVGKLADGCQVENLAEQIGHVAYAH